MKRRLSLALFALAACEGLGAAATGAPCPAERATYRLKSDPAFTARFVPALHHASVASRLYLGVRSPRRQWWFVFGASQGYGGLFVEPVSDPTLASAREDGPKRLGGEADAAAVMAFLPMTRSLDLLPDAPQPGEAAPDAFLVPDLGSRLWYDPVGLAGDPEARPEAMKQGIFVRSGCSASIQVAFP
jgi:hypothetical protein